MYTPTDMAYRVALAIMRDNNVDADLRLSAAHVAIVLQHAPPEDLQALDALAQGESHG